MRKSNNGKVAGRANALKSTGSQSVGGHLAPGCSLAARGFEGRCRVEAISAWCQVQIELRACSDLLQIGSGR